MERKGSKIARNRSMRHRNEDVYPPLAQNHIQNGVLIGDNFQGSKIFHRWLLTLVRTWFTYVMKHSFVTLMCYSLC